MKVKGLASSLVCFGLLAGAPAAMAEDAAEEVVVPEPGVLRDCRGTSYDCWDNFDEAKEFLDGKFELEGNVWQAPSEDDIWDAWCAASASSGQLESDGENIFLVGDQLITFPEDGNTAYFRTESKSGGMTIDVVKIIKNKKDIYKVHLKV